MRAVALKPSLKNAARFAGWALSLAALVFFLRLIGDIGISLPARSDLEIACAVAAGSTAYAAAVGLLALAWLALAAPARSCAPLPKAQIVSGYLQSQFAKYLPGNVFQYVARHALGRQLGIAHGTLAAAAIAEAALLVCAAATLMLLFGAPVLQKLLPGLPAFPPWTGLLCVLAVPIAHALIRYAPAPRWIPRYPLSRLLLALLAYFGFFAVFGGLFWAILQWGFGSDHPLAELIGGSSAAWLAGFVVPGAPAGAGLREAALVFATGAAEPTDELLSAIVFFRVVTLGGDLLAFVAGWLMSRVRGRAPR